MRVLARITPGPSWLPGHDVWGQGPVIRAHLAHMRDRFDAGELLVGGPLRRGMAGMGLLEVADLEAALAFAVADPRSRRKCSPMRWPRFSRTSTPSAEYGG